MSSPVFGIYYRISKIFIMEKLSINKWIISLISFLWHAPEFEEDNYTEVLFTYIYWKKEKSQSINKNYFK